MSWTDDDIAPTGKAAAWTDDDVAPAGSVSGNGAAQADPAILNPGMHPVAERVGKAGRVLVNALASPAVLASRTYEKATKGTRFEVPMADLDAEINRGLDRLGIARLDPNSTREQVTNAIAKTAPGFLLPANLGAQVVGNAAIAAADAPVGQEGTAATIGAAGGAAVPVLGKALAALGKGASHVLGTTTGAGAESVKQAFRNAPGFVENMRGNVEPGAVVEQARQGLGNMRQQMYQHYATAKGGWASDTTPLDMQPIADAYKAASDKFSFKGVPQPGVEQVKQQVETVLGDWVKRGQADPSFMTVEGLDALKRHLSTIVPADMTNRTGRAFVSEVVDAVKGGIVKQRPDYADAMKRYWQEAGQLDEIERSLSLGDKATTDTALRKLQSLMRNNVNTNYGQRLQSAAALATQGGEDVLPAVAGQAMNSWTPRGLQGAAAMGAGAMNPSALVAAPLTSPRIVGETARAAGVAARSDPMQATIEALRRFIPAASRSRGE